MAPKNSVDKDHELWTSQLVDDVLGKDNDKVHMEKVVMIIWQFRDDPSVIQFMAQFVSKFAGQRDVFAGIEFYLPQLAHMIIHLEVDWDDAILERFALIIAQQSLHFALQLNWILQGAIEDYEPELTDGTPNPKYQPLFYSRCVKLLTNIERCVVYGRPRSAELLRLFEKGKITKQEYDILEHADRRFNALQITEEQAQEDALGLSIDFGGTLLYKRKVRQACYKTKPWKERYFCIDDRMLHCYNNMGGKLVRSMPLENAIVGEVEQPKYDYMFFVENRGFHFVMRAKSEADKLKWMELLQEEAKAHGLFGPSSSKNNQSVHNNHMLEAMTDAQRSRFDFFKHERDFVRDLTNIAEDLRFEERAERKALAPGFVEKLVIPPVVYIPLVRNTDIWRRVAKSIPKDTKVFNTNERCPIILHFVSKRGELLESVNPGRGGMKDANLDVLEYTHLQFDILESEDQGAKTNGGATSMDVIEEDLEGESRMASPRPSSSDLAAAGAIDPPDPPEGQSQELVSTGNGGVAAVVQQPSAINNISNITDSDHSLKAAVWHDEVFTDDDEELQSEAREPIPKGNRQVRAFLRDNLSSLPRKLGDRINSQRNLKMTKGGRRKSALDMATGPFETIPIVEGNASNSQLDDDERSTVSVERSSGLANSSIFLGDHQEGDITMESINRAKTFVAGGESWADKTKRMLVENVQDDEDGVTEIVSVMCKSNDDLRQEVFVMQMIHYYKSVFANANLPLWLKTYQILSVSQSTGMIEVLTDATSLDGLKKADGYPKEGGLRAYFEMVYGEPTSRSFLAAQRNFTHSLAAYSIVAYLLGLKDRHNGNIMIDTRGHLIHIDFGFAMGMAPGNEFSFERAPFKLTPEYVAVMGGPKSSCFQEFKDLVVEGLKEARKNSLIALGMVEIMMYKSNYPCFTGRGAGMKPLKNFERRLMLHVPDHRVERTILKLIDKSMDHFGTWFYDAFQKWSNDYEI